MLNPREASIEDLTVAADLAFEEVERRKLLTDHLDRGTLVSYIGNNLSLGFGDSCVAVAIMERIYAKEISEFSHYSGRNAFFEHSLMPQSKDKFKKAIEYLGERASIVK
jgi:hypothetical protein